MPLRTLTGDAILLAHEQNVQQWAGYLAHAQEVEDVWKGLYDVPSAIADSDLEIAEPSQAKAIIKKMMEMIAIRSTQSFEVVRYSNSDQERKIADKLERFCKAYKNELYKVTQKDVFRRAAWSFLMRGRVGLHTVYEKNAKHPSVRVRLYDGMDYFPMYGDDGIEWFTTERYVHRWELTSFFDNLSDKALKNISVPPDLRYDDEGNELNPAHLLRVIEYWDDNRMAWCVEDHKVQEIQHDYGMITLREARLGDTALSDKRWECEPFIGPVLNDLKMDAALTSKLANAIEAYFFPWVLFKDANGNLISLPSNQVPPGGIPVAPDTKVEVVNATANVTELKALKDILQNNVDKNTITNVAWNTQMGEESGFRANLALGLIQDSVADVRDQLEKCFGLVMGDVLALHKMYAPDGGWEYTMIEPGGRHLVQNVTEEDIGVHQEVKVTIKPAVPQDIVQMVTIYNQLGGPDPATGLPTIPPEARLRLSGLSDVIGDMTGFNEELERYMLGLMDDEVKQLNLMALKAKYYPEISEKQRQIESMERKRTKRETDRAEREIEKGMTDDMVIPAEILTDAAKMQQLVDLIARGQLPQHALEVVRQGMPLGAPGSPIMGEQGMPENMSPETMNIMSQLGYEMPTGLTGYEGMMPEVAPAAMQGAQPRRVVDQAAVQQESIERSIDRGALPPPR